MRNKSKPFIAIPIYQQIIYVLLLNTVIALTISVALNSSLTNNLIISHGIGLSVLVSFHLFEWFFSIRLMTVWVPIVLGTLFGIAIILVANSIFGDLSLDEVKLLVSENYTNLLRTFLIALFFCLIVVHFLVVRSRMMEVKNALQAEKIKNINNEKRMIETQLRLLQAQIEPHFLFNTLSNISSLVESDPALGQKMLSNLNHYLRRSLKRSRTTHSTLAQEIDLIHHYLEIFKIRMGDRLSYTINVSREVGEVALPPLLLQPLVENAIKHGLEPTVNGGTIMITARLVEDQKLCIEVVDTGRGFQSEIGSGVGLENVRERLKSIYGDCATLSVEINETGGVTVAIKVLYKNG